MNLLKSCYVTKLQGAVETIAAITNATEVVGDMIINAANKVIKAADKLWR